MRRNKMISGLVESFVYSLLVYLIFFEFAGFKKDFLTMNLQPLLIVVSVMALKYGVYISLQTVLFASFFFILAYCRLGNDPVVFFLAYDKYKFILMFFFVALALGKFSDKYYNKISELKDEKDRVDRELEEQINKNLELVDVNERLKTRIIGSRESILTLHKITVSIFHMKVEEIFTQILEILTQFLGADVVSIYLYNEQKKILRARLKVGKSKLENFFSLDKERYFEEVIQSKESMEIDIEKYPNAPLYIAPILKENEVLGVINIERLHYQNKEKYTFELLKVISEWVNNALVEAMEKEVVEREKNSFKNTRIYNLEYFNYIFDEDKKRKKIFGTDFISLEVENPGFSPEELNDRIKGKLRDIDSVAMNEKVIRFLFVNADKGSRELLLNRIKEIIPGADVYEI